MKKSPPYLLICGLLFFLSLTSAFTETNKTIAVLDFEVRSANPDYTYWGKGFAEFLSVELSDIPGIVLVDRSRRNDIMKEQAFTLSGMADETSAVELGKILSAQYLVSGEIFDMMGDLVVTVKLVNVETGLVDSSAKADGPPKNYKQIISSLSASLAGEIAPKEAARAELAKPEKPKELKEEEARVVLTAFSQAVDAVDKDNVQEAKEKLQVAQKIDKNNRAVKFYLSKLQSVSPKFNVEMIYYAPSINPATLGFLNKDRLFLNVSQNGLIPYYAQFPNPPGDDSHSDFNWEIDDGLYYALGLTCTNIGFILPLGQSWGISSEFSLGLTNNMARDVKQDFVEGTDSPVIMASEMALGFRLGLGYKLSDKVGFGLSGYVYESRVPFTYLHEPNGDSLDSKTWSGSASVGISLKPGQGRLNLDSILTVPFLKELFLNYDEKDYVDFELALYPLVWENTGIYALTQDKLFLALKEITEIYPGWDNPIRQGAASRTIVSLEYWAWESFAFRGGGEYDFLYLMNRSRHGFGLMGGLSMKLGEFTFDTNFTWMDRSLRFVPGYSAPDSALLIQISYDGLLTDKFGWLKER